MTVKGCGEPQHKNQIMVFQSIHLMTMCQNQSGGDLRLAMAALWQLQLQHSTRLRSFCNQLYATYYKFPSLKTLLSCFTGLVISLPGGCHPKPSVTSRPSPWAVCSGAASPPKHRRLTMHKTNVTKHKTDSFPQHRFYLILNIKA